MKNLIVIAMLAVTPFAFGDTGAGHSHETQHETTEQHAAPKHEDAHAGHSEAEHHEAGEEHHQAPVAGGERVGDPWPLSTCPVTGAELGSMGEPIVKVYDGREVRFCCKACPAKFEADPDKYLAKADKEIIAQQKANYPLDHCIVQTEEKLSEDESENRYAVVGNRLFILCCPPCEEKVRAEPEKYIAKLDEAVIAKQSADYPLTTCLVSGDKLGGDMGEAINYVYRGELVKLCCKGCIKEFKADPAKFMKKLHEAKSTATK